MKLDVGRGGDPVDGLVRRFDIGYRVADALDFHGTDLVSIQLAAGSRLPTADGQKDCPGSRRRPRRGRRRCAQALLRDPRIKFPHQQEE